MLRRGRCASPVSVIVQGRFWSSMVIEEQSEEHRLEGEKQPALRRAVWTNRAPTEPCILFHLFRLLRLLRLAAILLNSK
jgi:hypothetical protein